MTYRKKPVDVEAFRWEGQDRSQSPPWMCIALDEGQVSINGLALIVYTAQGPNRVNRGDWVIRAADGRMWGTDDVYFHDNYESVSNLR